MIFRWVWLFVALLLFGITGHAFAQTLPSTVLDEADGLLDLAPVGVSETKGHLMLIATQNGAFAFNGKRVIPVDARNGLPDHGAFVGLLVAKGYATLFTDDTFFVAVDAGDIIDGGHFVGHRVDTEQGSINDLVSLDGGLLIVQSRQFTFFDTGLGKSQSLPSYLSGSLKIQSGDRIVRAAADGRTTLWYVTQHGWLCRRSQADTRCQHPTPIGDDSGLSRPLIGSNGAVYVRSLNHLYKFGPDGALQSSEFLPDQDMSLSGYSFFYSLVFSPTGDLITQSAHGIIQRHANTWRLRRTGATALVTAIDFDQGGNLWISYMGRGLAVLSGFDSIENFTRDDGLTSNTIWSVGQTVDGSVLAGSSGGIDRIRASTVVDHLRDVAGTTFAILSGRVIIAREGSERLKTIDSVSSKTKTSNIPDIQTLTGSWNGAGAWGISPKWIYHFEEGNEPSADGAIEAKHLLKNVTATFRSSGAWTIDDESISEWVNDVKGLHELHRIVHPWPPDFSPITATAAAPDTVWVGGTPGLCRLDFSADHVRLQGRTCYGGKQIGGDTVVSLLADRGGRLWVGTTKGLATFDGKIWRFINRSNGLIWNDLDQDALFEDKAHGLWIGTSQGLSHLTSPNAILRRDPPNISISRVSVAGRILRGKAVAFRSGGLTADLGSPGCTTPGRLGFRYRVVGADTGWNESNSGQISYPYLPYGHLRLQAMAVDELDHVTSPVAEYDLTVQRPTYLQPAALIGYAIAALAVTTLVIFTSVRLTDGRRRAYARRLEEQVAVRTAELDAARREIEERSRLDGLTGIANRVTIEGFIRQQVEQRAEFSVLLIDIDFFKKINDEFGHMTGDAVLKEFAARLAKTLSEHEACGRFGGEEFIVCLPVMGTHAETRALTIIGQVTGSRIQTSSRPLQITCSGGIAYRESWDTWETLLERSDAALYEAKSAGRNRLMVGTSTAARPIDASS